MSTAVSGTRFDDLLRRLDPVHPGHTEIHDHDVGPTSFGERDGRFAVGCLADDADVRRAEEREPEAFPDDLMVVGDEKR